MRRRIGWRKSLGQGLHITNSRAGGIGIHAVAQGIQYLDDLLLVVGQDIGRITLTGFGHLFRKFVEGLILGKTGFQLSEIVLESKLAGIENHEYGDDQPDGNDTPGIGKPFEQGISRFLLPLVKEHPVEALKNDQDGGQYKKHARQGEDDAAARNEPELGKAAELGEHQHKQRESRGKSTDHDSGARLVVGVIDRIGHVHPFRTELDITGIEMDAVVNAHPEEDHEEHRGHRIKHTEHPIGDAEGPYQADHQRYADHQYRNGNP